MGNSDSKDNAEGSNSQDSPDRVSDLFKRCKLQEECWEMVENESLLKELVNIATRNSHNGTNLNLVLDLLAHVAKNCIIDFDIDSAMINFNEFNKGPVYDKLAQTFYKNFEAAGGYTALSKLLLSCAQSVEKKETKEKVAVAIACCSSGREKIDSTIVEPLVSTIFDSLKDCKMDESLRIYNLLCATYSCFFIVDTAKIFFQEIKPDHMMSVFMKFLDHKDPCILIKSFFLLKRVFMCPVSISTLDTFMKLVPGFLSNFTNILTCGKSIKPLSITAPVSVPVPESLPSPLCFVSATSRDTRVSSLGICVSFIKCLCNVSEDIDATQLAVIAEALADGKIWNVLLIAFELFDSLHALTQSGDVHEHVDGDFVVLTNYSRERYKMHVAGLLTNSVLGFITDLMNNYPPIVPIYADFINTAALMVLRQRDFVQAGGAKPMGDTGILVGTAKDLELGLKRMYLVNISYAARYLFLVCQHGSKHPDPKTAKNSVRARVDACGAMTIFPIIVGWLEEDALEFPDESVVSMGVDACTYAAMALCLLHRGSWPPQDKFKGLTDFARIQKDIVPDCRWIWDEMKEEK